MIRWWMLHVVCRLTWEVGSGALLRTCARFNPAYRWARQRQRKTVVGSWVFRGTQGGPQRWCLREPTPEEQAMYAAEEPFDPYRYEMLMNRMHYSVRQLPSLPIDMPPLPSDWWRSSGSDGGGGFQDILVDWKNSTPYLCEVCSPIMFCINGGSCSRFDGYAS
jgi:hypothetical protein